MNANRPKAGFDEGLQIEILGRSKPQCMEIETLDKSERWKL